jgi:hypothetical protein
VSAKGMLLAIFQHLKLFMALKPEKLYAIMEIYWVEEGSLLQIKQ